MNRTIPVPYDCVLGMIQSHARRDDLAFQEKVGGVIRELNLSNRPGEAKLLRDSLGGFGTSGGTGAERIRRNERKPDTTLAMMNTFFPATRATHGGEPLISRPVRTVATDDLVLAPVTAVALEKIKMEYRNRKRLAEAGLAPASRVLFWGPPGCGKTLAAHWLANELGLSCGIVRLSAVITSYVGETAANLQKIFRQANAEPMVLLLDEADAVAKKRESRNDVDELKRVVNSLLQNMDEIEAGKSIVVFASNHQHLFDSAVWRRFDEVVEFPLPSLPERLALLKRLTNGLRFSGKLETVARATGGASFADIARVCAEAAKTAVLRGTDESVDVKTLTTIWKDWQQRQTDAAGGDTGKPNPKRRSHR